MRVKLLICAVLALAVGMSPAVAQAAKHHHKSHHHKKHHKKKKIPKARYYVALGDSLAVGYQPNSSGVGRTTTTGYVDDLFNAEKSSIKHLNLEKLGCAYETTSSMMSNPASCGYGPYQNQLAAAVAFLKQHKGQIAFVTIDIGANDIDRCVNPSTGAVDNGCLIAGENDIQTNLPIITQKLRAAAGKSTPIIGMTYYDPFLAAWFAGTNPPNSSAHSQGVMQAQNSQLLAHHVNKDIITPSYQNNGARVAAVDDAFHTYDAMTDTDPGPAALICQDTWMCAPSPVGPNIHANDKGYQLIAQTFEATKP